MFMSRSPLHNDVRVIVFYDNAVGENTARVSHCPLTVALLTA